MTSYRICEPHRIGHKQWAVYDTFLQIYCHPCFPAFKSKFEAEQDCRKLNKEYKAQKISRGMNYKTHPEWSMLQ